MGSPGGVIVASRIRLATVFWYLGHDSQAESWESLAAKSLYFNLMNAQHNNLMDDIYVKHITIRVPFTTRLRDYLELLWECLTRFPPATESDLVECSKEEAEWTFGSDAFPIRYIPREYEGPRTDVHHTASYVSGEGPRVKISRINNSC